MVFKRSIFSVQMAFNTLDLTLVQLTSVSTLELICPVKLLEAGLIPIFKYMLRDIAVTPSSLTAMELQSTNNARCHHGVEGFITDALLESCARFFNFATVHS